MPTTSYVKITRNKYNREEMEFDSARFAKDLAAELNGKAESWGESHIPMYKIILPDATELLIYWRGYGADAKAGKVSIEVMPENVPYDLRPIYGNQYALPTIGVSTNRPIAHIAADIKRRLLPASIAPMAARREYINQRRQCLNNMASARDNFAREYPAFRVLGEKDSAKFSYYKNGKPHMSGLINSDGSIKIDMLGTLSAEQFRALYTILYSS